MLTIASRTAPFVLASQPMHSQKFRILLYCHILHNNYLFKFHYCITH